MEDFEKLFFNKEEEVSDLGNETPAPEDIQENDDTEDNKEDIQEEPKEDAEEEKPSEDDKDRLKLKPKKKAQERIDELTREKHEIRREAEEREAALLKKIEELLAPKKEEPAAVEEKPTGAPTPDDLDENGEPKYPLGEFDPAFIDARVQFMISKEREAIRQEAEAEKVKAEQEAAETKSRQALEELQSSWNEKLEKAEEAFPDIREKGSTLDPVFNSLEPAYGEYLATTLMSLDHGPEILYYLAENPDEAKSIAQAGPVKATIALGILEAQFSGNKKTEVKVTSAPEPPAIRARGTGARTSIPADTDDLSAFEREFFRKK
jgi:hypothetical protein